MDIARSLITIQEIIVERDSYWLNAINSQLYTESLACCSLTTTGRTCYQHHLDAFITRNLIGNTGNFLLLKSLAKLDELVGISFLNTLNILRPVVYPGRIHKPAG